ncbi:hypothetical protein HPB50_004361 [Hyalomma asiaticum]|uniref:Uncharacterized protein n=1 Tax=Hyalomma asiaticum TaxID=266040 RepID=A0ACB7S1D3_HYAAI|nr:hypothetical protein HPB50_004361 [Hyalomma asiaticum]
MLSDCAFRSRFKSEYFVNVDFDELAVPSAQYGADLSALIDSVERSRGAEKVGSLIMRNRVFCYEHQVKHDYARQHVLPLMSRILESHVSVVDNNFTLKYIARAGAVCSAAIHRVTEFCHESEEAILLDSSELVMNHYRKCCDYGVGKEKSWGVDYRKPGRLFVDGSAKALSRSFDGLLPSVAKTLVRYGPEIGQIYDVHRMNRALRSSRRTAQSRTVETEGTATRAFLRCFPGVLRTTRTLAASPLEQFAAGLERASQRKSLLTYHDITLHYCLSRLTFPPPHQSLSQHQQHLWRQLQAHTFLTPARLALFHPGTYSPACRLCGSSIANYQHIFYSCPAHLPPASWHLRSPQQWEAALSSTRPDLQLRLVTWAEDVAARHCLDATTGSLEAAHNAAFQFFKYYFTFWPSHE